jgi:SOS-response transcriptional repressor LexA
MTIGARIRERRKSLGLTMQDVAAVFGISRSAVSEWESDRASPGIDKLPALARKLQTSVNYLIAGKENHRVSEAKAEYNAVEVSSTDKIPLISWVSAGNWCESPDTFAPGDAEEWLPLPNKAGPRSFALRIDGDSMTAPYPGVRSYSHGTIIYVDPDRAVTNGCRVVARTPDGHYTFKVYLEDAGRKYLRPINPQYPTIDITEHMHVCGVVIGSYLPE